MLSSAGGSIAHMLAWVVSLTFMAKQGSLLRVINGLTRTHLKGSVVYVSHACRCLQCTQDKEEEKKKTF